MKRIIALVLNIGIIVLEILGTFKSVQEQGVKVIRYYTENSNYLALISAVVFVIFLILKMSSKVKNIPKWVSYLKLMAVSCVMLTFIVVVTILSPTMGGYKFMLLYGSMLYHHLICPLLCLISFMFFEENPVFNKSSALIAFIPTALYAAIILVLNILKVLEGPYPFLMVYKQPVYISVIWFVVILGGSFLISVLVAWGSNLKSKKALAIE